MLVQDFLQTETTRISPDANLLEAAGKMLAHRTETLLVYAEEKFMGVIGLRDLFTAPIPAHYGNTMHHRQNEMQLIEIWKTTVVRDLMNDKVLTVNSNETLIRALELMVNTGKHPLPVTREGKVIGVISRLDVVRAVLEQAKSMA